MTEFSSSHAGARARARAVVDRELRQSSAGQDALAGEVVSALEAADLLVIPTDPAAESADWSAVERRRRELADVQGLVLHALGAVEHARRETSARPVTVAGEADEYTDGIMAARDRMAIAAQELRLAAVLVRAEL